MAEDQTQAPRGVRLVITLVGRRNAGKSSLINAITGQDVAIVSDHAGTTTDPVAKPYELLPLGPVTLLRYRRPGRCGRTRGAAHRRHQKGAVAFGHRGRGRGRLRRASPRPNAEIIADIRSLDIPFLLVWNKTDLAAPVRDADLAWCQAQGIRHGHGQRRDRGAGATAVKDAIMDAGPARGVARAGPGRGSVRRGRHRGLRGAHRPGRAQGPAHPAAGASAARNPRRRRRGRDGQGTRTGSGAFGNLRRPPALVITDSQVILKVARATCPTTCRSPPSPRFSPATRATCPPSPPEPPPSTNCATATPCSWPRPAPTTSRPTTSAG